LFIFILKITKTATKFSTTETKMFTISRTKNTQARQTSALFFVFFYKSSIAFTGIRSPANYLHVLETTYAIELYSEVPEPSDRGTARFTWSLKRLLMKDAHIDFLLVSYMIE
jgi:hypothetical protein